MRTPNEYVVSMASTHTSEVTEQSITYLGPQRTKTHYNAKVVFYISSDVGVDFNKEYIGESTRTFGGTCREQFKAPSPLLDDQTTIGHPTNIDMGQDGV